ncbi:MAG: ATP-dependent DNA helicase RecG [Planctomycetaceae bacterium]|nr:ATP-dependent DNA helicase RecG [Planctomycetaceae bacterium]
MKYPERTDVPRKPTLTSPVSLLRGYRGLWSSPLEKLGVGTIRDLLFFFPRDYECTGELVDLAELEEASEITVIGEIEEIRAGRTRYGKSLFSMTVGCAGSLLKATWFNMHFMKGKFQAGDRIVLSGLAKPKADRWEMTHPRISMVDEDTEVQGNEVLPVYRLSQGISQPAIRKLIRNAVEDYVQELEEAIPELIRTQKGIGSIHEAVRGIHMPDSLADVDHHRLRFVYQELLVLQLALALRRWHHSITNKAPELKTDARIHARITARFPFELTAAQQRVVQDICHDMANSQPMNRLLQGDVGSGKTVVAEYAMLLSVAHGHQAVLMAPTEILAQQHYRTLQEDLKNSRVNIGLLTGSMTTTQRRQVLNELVTGEIDLLIGTHSVASEEVEFKSLALVVIDEQHKFGVRQRMAVRNNGLDPHYLVMSATPIPRTIAMGMFADLDISTIRQGPDHQQPVHSYLGDSAEREKWWDFFRGKLREGRQGYVIASTVERATREDLMSVEEIYEGLKNRILSDFRIGVVHGKMSPADKEDTMHRFHSHELDVLVATSVIEVGVNVPNASVMTIEDAQQFGLAQLHQLRGRVRRGHHTGYVCVFGTPVTDEAEHRLQAFVNTLDGFELAEIDFDLRGPGDLFGTKQHGMPPLRVADLRRDRAIVELARDDAQAMLESDPGLQSTEFVKLRKQVLRRYGRVLDVGDVG